MKFKTKPKENAAICKVVFFFPLVLLLSSSLISGATYCDGLKFIIQRLIIVHVCCLSYAFNTFMNTRFIISVHLKNVFGFNGYFSCSITVGLQDKLIKADSPWMIQLP